MSSTADSGGSCASDLPQSCPTITPSYKSDIQPILQSYCLSCHGPNGAAGYDMSTYARVAAQQSAILDQVYGCLMPTANYAQPSLEQRLTLLGWLVCNAPNN